MPVIKPSSSNMPPATISHAALSYSPAGAAGAIGLSKRQIYNLLSDGTITGRRSGSRTLIDGESLRAYYASLPAYVPGATMPNAPQMTKRRTNGRSPSDRAS